MQNDRQEIATRIEEATKLSFEGSRFKGLLKTSGWGATTKFVKETLGDLGKQLGYQICASGYAGADDGEWLYDMVWYNRSSDRLLSNIAMVLESEFNPGGGGLNATDVDGDFEKLVQARAEVRVWLALLPNSEMERNHIMNCKRQATSFNGALPGDVYVFIIYN